MENGFSEALRGAKFLHPEEDVKEVLYPREPPLYTPKRKFRQRMRELSGIVDGDIISDCINYGELVKAEKDCVAFVHDLGGVTISVVVTDEIDIKRQHELEGLLPQVVEKEKGLLDLYAVTIWPYIYDRDKALDTGRWSSKDLWRIEEYTEEHKQSWEETDPSS